MNVWTNSDKVHKNVFVLKQCRKGGGFKRLLGTFEAFEVFQAFEPLEAFEAFEPLEAFGAFEPFEALEVLRPFEALCQF